MRTGSHLPLLLVALTALTQAAQDRVATLQEAARRIGSRDLAGADSLLQGLLKSSPDDALALNLLGFVRMQQNNPAQAEELFRRAIEKGPYLPGPRINLATLYGTARPEDAIGELAKALRLAPDSEQAKSVLVELAPRAAAVATHAGEKDRALALMLRAHEALPHDPDLLVDTALAAMEKGLYPDGEKYLSEALQARPDYLRATYALARCYLAESKLPPAEQQMRRYLQAKPDDATAQYGLGLILAAEQKADEARAAFEKSLALEPKQTESLYQLGQICLLQGNKEKAAEDFRKVLERDPRHAGALTELGVMAFRKGDVAEAEGTLERAAVLAPSFYKAHYYYALTLKKLGRADEAEKEFKIATDLQKHDEPVARLALDQH